MSGLNRFDTPAQDQYRNTYVPLPYEQVMGTVAARQAQLQREQDMLSKVYDDTQNIKYIPGTKDEAYVKDYLTKAGDLVNKYYGQDLSDPIVKNQLRQQFAAMTDKPAIQNIQMSQAAWMTNQKYKGQLKAEGLYDPAIDEDPANASFDSRNGVYQYVAPSYKNPRSSAEQYFNNIKPSDIGPSGDYNYSGITRDRINSVVGQKWGEFVNTSEGNNYVKKIAKEQGLDYTDPKVRQQIGTDYLKGVGEEYIYRDQGTPTLGAQTRAAMSKKGTPNSDRINTTQEQTIRSKDSFDPMGLGKVQFKENGDVWVPDKRGSMPTSFGYGALHDTVVADKNYRVEANAEEKALSTKLEALRTKMPQLKNLSDKDTYQAYRDLTKDGKAFPDLPKIELPTVARKGYAESLASSLLDRSVMVMDDFGTSDLRSTTDNSQKSPLQDLGYTTQSLKQQLQLAADGNPKALVSIGGLAQNGPMSGMLQLEVQDLSGKGGNKGKMRKLYISTNDQMKAIMSPTNDVYNAIRSFQGGVIPIGTDKDGRTIAVKVTPNVQKDPVSNKWIYDYQLNEGTLNPDKSFEQGDPIHIDDLKRMTLDRLTNSGYLNSEVSFTKEKTKPSF